MRRFLTFVWYELLMHVKSWRLWLCLVLLLAVPWLVAQASSDPSEPRAWSWMRVLDEWWLLTLVLIVITVDTVARVRATGVQPVLFTKPFSTMTYILAGWVSVVLLAAVLAGAQLLSGHYATLRLLQQQSHVAALGWILGLSAVPMAVALVALVIWMRTVFKHNVSAYIASAAAAVLLAGIVNGYRVPLLGWNLEMQRPLAEYYVPAIGRDLDWRPYGWAFLNTVLFSLLFIALSCYHMRRQEPQRRVLGSYGKRWSDMPTFVTFFFDLKIDRRVGGEVHLLLLATLVAACAVTARTVSHARAERQQKQEWAVQLRRGLRENGPKTPGVWIRHYAGRLAVESREHVTCDVRMDVMSTTATTMEHLALELPFGVDVTRVENGRGEPLNRRQWANIIVADLDAPLGAGATTTIRLAYSGCPRLLTIGNLMPFSEQYAVTEQRLENRGVILGSRYLRIGNWLLPRSVALVRRHDGIYPDKVPRLFTLDLEFAAFSDLEVVSPEGTIESLKDTNGGNHARLRIDWPRNDFTLLAGPYEPIEWEFGATTLSVYALRKDADLVDWLLNEYSETIERFGGLLGGSPRRRYALIETPYPQASVDNLPPATLYTLELDRIRHARPFYEAREREGHEPVYSFQNTLRAALAVTVLRESFHPVAELEPLKRGLYVYLLGNIERSRIGFLARRSSRLFALRSDRGGFLGSRDLAAFDKPLLARMADLAYSGFRTSYIWRMLHYLMEDEKFAEFIRTLLAEYGDRLVTLEDLHTLAERIYGEPLAWFFDQWFHGTGVPHYTIAQARATMVENPRTRDIEYDVKITVANRGRGKMPVPVVLRTERDTITRRVWLDSETTDTLTLRVPDRPEVVAVDPQGWIAQSGQREDKSRQRGAAQRAVRVVE